MSPTAALELGITASGSYDNLISAASDDSTSGYTVLTGAKTSDTNGGTLLSYYLGQPPAAAVKPGLLFMGGGDAVVIASWMLK